MLGSGIMAGNLVGPLVSGMAAKPADARAARGGRGASRIRRSVAKKARKI
jgi:hypothetical protein